MGGVSTQGIQAEATWGVVDLGTDGSLGVLSIVDTQRCCKEIRKKWCWDWFGGVGEGWGSNQQKKSINIFSG